MPIFIESVFSNKNKFLMALGSAAIIGLLEYLYGQYQSLQKNESVDQEEVNSPLLTNDLRKEISKFKRTIHFTNPSIEEVKQIVTFTLNMVYKQINRIQHHFKEKRHILKSEGNLKEYFNQIRLVLKKLQEVSLNLRQAILVEIEVPRQVFVQNKSVVQKILQEFKERLVLEAEIAPLEVFKSMQDDLLNLLKGRGDQLVSNVAKYCYVWYVQAKKQDQLDSTFVQFRKNKDAQAKQLIRCLFSTYMYDEMDAINPSMNKYSRRYTGKKFKKQMANQTALVNQQYQLLISKLIKQLGRIQKEQNNLSTKQTLPQKYLKSIMLTDDLIQEIGNFKATINLENPTLEEVKQILAFTLNMVHKQTGKIHNHFKLQRRILKLFGSPKEYFNQIRHASIKLRQISLRFKQLILTQIGVPPQVFEQYKNALSGFIQEQKKKLKHGQEIAPLHIMKSMLKDQLNLLKERGDQLVSTIAKNCKDWDAQAKKQISAVLIIYICDEVAEINQQYDKYDINSAERMYAKQLERQNAKINQEIQRLVPKLAIQLGMIKKPQHQ